MKRILSIGIVILIGSVLSGCVDTCHDTSVHYKRARIVRVIEHRGHYPRGPRQHHRRPIAPPWHRR
ncbi:MAG: hypothetical protein GY809_04965 [Planctomycetes bacterium]|nr:hypothetical protein [Planctomycetota bacterium]